MFYKEYFPKITNILDIFCALCYTVCMTMTKTCRRARGAVAAGHRNHAARAAAEAALLKAMAHPARMRILRELAYAERCVGDLAAAVGGSISTVSRHLAHLHAAGIVRTRKRGTYVFYAWSAPCVGNILTCVHNMLRHNARRQPAAAARHTTTQRQQR